MVTGLSFVEKHDFITVMENKFMVFAHSLGTYLDHTRILTRPRLIEVQKRYHLQKIIFMIG